MSKLANSMPHVAILLESTYATHTQILRGILRFTQLHTPWTLDVRMGRAGEPTSFGAGKWKVDGIIANRLPPELSALIRRHRTPTIVMNDISRLSASGAASTGPLRASGCLPTRSPGAAFRAASTRRSRAAARKTAGACRTGYARFRVRPRSSPPTTSAPGKCSTPATRRDWRCRTTSRSSAWTTTRSSARRPRPRSRASRSRWRTPVSARPSCWTAS